MRNQLYCGIFFAALSLVASKYEIEILKFELLSKLINKDVVDPGTLRLKQEDRNVFVVSGTFEVKRNFDSADNIKLEYHQKVLTGKYMLLYMTTMTICETTKTQFYQKLKEASNFPEPDTCPIPKGNYTINNWIIDESFFPAVLPKGENYIMATTLVDGKPVYGARLYTNIKTV